MTVGCVIACVAGVFLGYKAGRKREAGKTWREVIGDAAVFVYDSLVQLLRFLKKCFSKHSKKQEECVEAAKLSAICDSHK